MAKYSYISKRFRPESKALIGSMNAIIEDYLADGMTLTLRQLYYRLVAADIIPNTERSYKRIGSLLADARMAGLVDWDAIVDRERNLAEKSTWSGPAEILRAAQDQLRYDHWPLQRLAVEVWVEKRALAEVVERACAITRTPWMACKGYMSITEMKAAADRIVQRRRANEQKTVILYLGDHDPSGLDMPRDILSRFCQLRVNYQARVEHIALKRWQIDEFALPPNPAKMTDSRSGKYVAQHGRESWELDAIEPNELIRIIGAGLQKYIDIRLVKETKKKENTDRQRIDEAIAALEVA